MVIVCIFGGLGNQLFQYAFGRYIAHKLNTEFKLDISICISSSNLHHNYYRLGEYNIVENFATPEEIQSARRFSEDDVKDIGEILNYHGDIYLIGYWCLEKYFIEIRDILLQELTLKNPLGKNSAAWRDKILAAECAVSLHVRMGDYLLSLLRNNDMISRDFYEISIAELKKENPNLTVFVFSDDLDWCKENFNFDVATEFVEGCESAAEEMYLMSLCRHNINPQGTFAWWSAWLNKNPDKKVFLRNSNDMLNNTVKISVGENARPLINFPPNLSIIVYIENQPAYIKMTLESILNQEFNDYEVILVDASTDGSRKICRQVATIDNVTVLTVNPTADKFIAWNKGLDVARGEYVLFLTAKEFIFSNVAKMTAQYLYNYLKSYLEPLGKYIYASNYGDDFPNVICSTQYLAEDDGGDIRVAELRYKRFFVKTDEAFSNLQIMLELNLDAEQKLMVLATKDVNNFVGTKFFKRKFLDENKLRFNEKMVGMDAELLFLVNAFLATEKILFVPQVLNGRLK